MFAFIHTLWCTVERAHHPGCFKAETPALTCCPTTWLLNNMKQWQHYLIYSWMLMQSSWLCLREGRVALRLANSYSFSELRSFVLEIRGSCLIQAKPCETDGCSRIICITWIIIDMGQIYNLDTWCHSSVLTQNIGQAQIQSREAMIQSNWINTFQQLQWRSPARSAQRGKMNEQPSSIWAVSLKWENHSKSAHPAFLWPIGATITF